MTDTAPSDPHAIPFMQLVSMLGMTALQQMGKLIHPGTGKAESDLESAQATIDILDMLEAKTRGNLGSAESKLLQDTLMSLKLNFVESRERQAAEPEPRPAAPAAQEPAGPDSAPQPGPDPKAGTPDAKPKFRKSYG